MDTSKQRRMLTETELLSIVESNEAELAVAEEKLGAAGNQILDGLYEPGMFAKMLKDGALKAATIEFENEPIFVMMFSRNGAGWLTVEGVASLKKSSFQHVFDAGHALAKHYGCPAVQWITKLSSLFRFGLGQGYKPLGIIMWKATA